MGEDGEDDNEGLMGAQRGRGLRRVGGERARGWTVGRDSRLWGRRGKVFDEGDSEEERKGKGEFRLGE